jgi:hypothetical protein
MAGGMRPRESFLDSAFRRRKARKNAHAELLRKRWQQRAASGPWSGQCKESAKRSSVAVKLASGSRGGGTPASDQAAPTAMLVTLQQP